MQDLKRQILARLYGAEKPVTVLAGVRFHQTGDFAGCWRGPDLEYWPDEGKFVVRLEDIQPLIAEKLAALSYTSLIPTAQGRDAWRRLGCPLPEATP